MDLTDLIIDSGPYVAGGVMPFPTAPNGHPIITAVEINALRDQLIELRRLKAAAEAQQRFTFPHQTLDDEYTYLACDRCHWTYEITGGEGLAELLQRADEHTEVCR